MANGRQSKKGSAERDGGTFLALPNVVLDSHAYRNLSFPAKALLTEIGRQINPQISNNGRLLCSMSFLSLRGWTSPSTINRAKKELIRSKLIYETVKGCRPNKASWYAVTWLSINKHLCGYDTGAVAGFLRSGYMNDPFKNAVLSTPTVLVDNSIATYSVLETPPPSIFPIAVSPLLSPPPSISPVHL